MCLQVAFLLSKQQALARDCFPWLSTEDGKGGVTDRRGSSSGFLSLRVFYKQACWIQHTQTRFRDGQNLRNTQPLESSESSRVC